MRTCGEDGGGGADAGRGGRKVASLEYKDPQDGDSHTEASTPATTRLATNGSSLGKRKTSKQLETYQQRGKRSRTGRTIEHYRQMFSRNLRNHPSLGAHQPGEFDDLPDDVLRDLKLP